MRLSTIVFAGVALAGSAAWAQPAGPVETRLESRKVTRAADGKETLAPAPSARPGDVIEYTATYRNTGKQPVKALEATLPIPPNTELVQGSARPAGALASVDGQSYAAPPLKRKVVRDGKTIEEEIPVAEYRFLRWRASDLAGEASSAYAARVKVIDDTSPAAAKPAAPK